MLLSARDNKLFFLNLIIMGKMSYTRTLLQNCKIFLIQSCPGNYVLFHHYQQK